MHGVQVSLCQTVSVVPQALDPLRNAFGLFWNSPPAFTGTSHPFRREQQTDKTMRRGVIERNAANSRGREKKKKWEGSSSLGVFATRISAPRREFRARGANFGHVGRISDISDVLATAKFELCIFFSAHLGPQGASRGTSRSPRPAVSQGRV